MTNTVFVHTTAVAKGPEGTLAALLLGFKKKNEQTRQPPAGNPDPTPTKSHLTTDLTHPN